MSEETFKDLIYKQQTAVVTIGNDELVIKPQKGPAESIHRGDIEYSEYVRNGNYYTLQLFGSSTFFAISMIKSEDTKRLMYSLEKEIDVQPVNMDTVISGKNAGQIFFDEHGFGIKSDDKQIINLPYPTITGVQAGKNDFFVTMLQDPNADGIQLETARFYVPPTGELKIPDIFETIHTKINQAAGTENYIAQVEELKFRAPAGTASLRYCEELLYIQFEGVGLKVKYSSIKMIHRLQKPETNDFYVVLTLDHPVKKGNTSYDNIVIEAEDVVPNILNDPDSELKEADALISLFKRVAGKNEVEHDDFFQSSINMNAVQCNFKNSSAYLYLTNKNFIILPKCRIIPYDTVRSVEFTRISEGYRKNKDFDLQIVEHSQASKVIEFKNIPISEFSPLLKFFQERKIHIKNKGVALDFEKGKQRGSEARLSKLQAKSKIDEEQAFAGSDSDDEEEDEDFDPNKKSSSDDENPEEEEEMVKSDEDEKEEEDKGDDKKDESDE